MSASAKKLKIVRPGDNIMMTVPDLDRAKIDAQCFPSERKKIPIREAEANLGQNSPKSAVRVMQILRGLIFSAFHQN